MTPEIQAAEVLLALEKAARMPNFHLVDLNEVFGTKNWNAVQNIKADVDPFSEGLDSRIIDAELISRFMASAFRMDAIVSMLNVLSGFANEIQMHLRRSQDRISAKLSKGISKLPDEIVMRIFQFAVWEEDCNGGKQAISLSHVSRRFRNIALGSRRLWTTLYSCDPEGQLETFISRAGSSEEFHAFINFTSAVKEEGIGYLTDICHSTITRWRTLTLSQEDQDLDADEPLYGGVELIAMHLAHDFASESLLLPILEKLEIHGHSEDVSCYGLEGHPFADESYNWAPNLRTISCSYILPSPSGPLPSVTTFTFTQSIAYPSTTHSLDLLLKFLGKVPNLSSCVLELYGANEEGPEEPLPLTECSAVTSLHLRLRNLIGADFRGQRSCIASFMDALRMPSLESFSVSLWFSWIGGRMAGHCDWGEVFGKLSNTLAPYRFWSSTRLASLSYELRCERDLRECVIARDFAKKEVVFSVALDRIFHIPSVIISSWFRVDFTLDSDFVPHADTDERCNLRELNFVGCDNLTAMDLSSTVSTLSHLGIWDDIKQVVVQDCDRLSYEDAVDVVGEKRLQFLLH
ncbi:hypothetical protein SCHPADRAFT_946589 [Schizopora paradoxa]|uniref:F-box domain-containing protein n=1 Tax=Schizopora paradoxa TaxID=27342 RepID=A0A0H2R3A2_9AGAM|nr:hypothetical protein SCHPADRAFT_946589 [Schizopora paradoxa]